MNALARKLLRTSLASVISFSIAATPVLAAPGMQGEAGQFFYRYKDNISVTVPPDTQGKDIRAFYVAGVGVSFSELLPLKPEWQDDSWAITAGTLPEGITFNPSTRNFEGIPTGAVKGQTVDLVGTDTNGNQVATATATFDVFDIVGQPIPIDFYAHTGKYKLDQIAVPSGLSIYSWDYILDAPTGMTASGPFLEGIPAKAGKYNLFGYGKDYNGNVVATFFGPYLVEDGPTFPLVTDRVYPLPQLEYGKALAFNFGPPSINHVLYPSKPPLYFIELADGHNYPGTTASNGDAKNLKISGEVDEPYQTANARFKAIDSDDTVGYSNWFLFGSSNPQPSCNPNKSQSISSPIVFVTGKNNTVPMPRPYGATGTVSFTKIEGSFPAGISMDGITGLLSGTPKTSGEQTEFRIRVDVVNDEGTVSAECHYFTKVSPAGVAITDLTPEQDRHIRVGDAYRGIAGISGGIPAYTLSFADQAAYPSVSFTSPVTNSEKVTLAGTVGSAGANSIGLVLTNGDTSTKKGGVTVIAHPELSVGQVPDVHVKRLASTSQLASIPYDPASVIPDVATGKQPIFTLAGPTLPEGVTFVGDKFHGATAAAVGTHGPYLVTMSDFSGDKVTTNAFNVVVDERDPVKLVLSRTAMFDVEAEAEQSVIPADVIQPPGASAFSVEWELNGALPSWLSFDTTSGKITAQADIPYETLVSSATYGPFTLTVTDSDGSTATSSAFDVTLREKPSPAAHVSRVWRGNVSGTKLGEAKTSVSISGIRAFVDADTIYGTRDEVTLLSSEPVSPAGLVFDPAAGTFNGEPKSEFNGKVAVRFKDTKDREGVIDIPLEVRPYPVVGTTTLEFELPRLSNASLAGIAPVALSGFWQTQPVQWAVDTVRGVDIAPHGLSVSAATGLIAGRSTDAEGTVIKGIVLSATTSNPLGETMTTWTDPFDVRIVKPSPMSLTYAPDTQTYFLKTDGNGGYLLDSVSNTKPAVTGSFEAPLVYSADRDDALAAGMPPALDVNQTSGLIAGVPSKLGIWTLPITVADKEGSTNANGAFPLKVKSTLAGSVEHSAAMVTKLLRIGEPFTAPAIPISNEVPPVVFQVTPSTTEASALAGFDVQTGAFTDQSLFETPKSGYDVFVRVKDAHDRGFKSAPARRFTVYDRLGLKIYNENVTAKQYSSENPISVDFNPDVKWGIGDITFSMGGDIPGTLVSKNYVEGVLSSYTWSDAAAVSHVLTVSENVAVEYRVDGKSVSHPSLGMPVSEQELRRARLFPVDALIFDTLSATLVGIPSKAGNYTAHVTAHDSHARDYIRDVSSRTTNNTSLDQSVFFSIAEADALAAVNSADREQLYQHTSQPTLVTSITNAAYGLDVTATAVSGSLPKGVRLSINGGTISYVGFPEVMGTFGDIVWSVNDAAGRTIVTPPVGFDVGPRTPFIITPGEPLVFAVNTAASQSVSTAGNAYGIAVKSGDWTLTGIENLPVGLVHAVQDGLVTFSGTPTVVGKTTGVTVRAVDSMGTVAVKTLTFDVVEPSGDIELEVSGISTKVGYPYEMQATSSNTYGKVRYYSYDLADNLAGQLFIDQSTGLVSGAFSSVGDRDFDIYVTDATNRVTSKPVLVNVMPDVRVTVPQIVQATQGDPLDQLVHTDYVLGTVNYSKGGGIWPEGVDVDPATGHIIGYDMSSGNWANLVLTAAGTYKGLTIRATDTFVVAGVTYTDTQESDLFSLVVAPTTATPDILDPSGKKVILGTQSEPLVAWKPDVIQKGSSPAKPFTAPWNFSGTTYTPSHDLSEYGLSFDSKTGVISGTPSYWFIIRDFTIRVTSQRGDTDITAPFWIGVAPKDPIVPGEDQKLVFNVRQNDSTIESEALVWKHLGGDGTHALKVPNGLYSVVQASGAFQQKASLPNYTADVTTNTLVTVVTDEFNRTGEVSRDILQRKPVTVSGVLVPAELDYNKAYQSEAFASVAGIYGKASWKIDGLPEGLTYDPQTGLVSGTIDKTKVKVGDIITLVFKVTDSLDGKSGSLTVPITAVTRGGYTYLDAGTHFSCAIDGQGALKCWGSNADGRLGTGNETAATLPVMVTGLTKDVNMVSTGGNGACAVLKNGQVKCWGSNTYGQIGNGAAGSTNKALTPQAVVGLGGTARSVSISVSNLAMTCAVLDGGGLKCWGYGGSGRLGTGNSDNSSTPVTPNGLGAGVQDVSVGGTSSCALLTTGKAKCWGSGSGGVLGTGDAKSSNVPVDLTVVSEPIAKITVGNGHACALLETGMVKCWGSNAQGQLGTGAGSASSSLTAVTPVGLGMVKDIVAGYTSTCALTMDGGMRCWGANNSGLLGNGSTTAAYSPITPNGMDKDVAGIAGNGQQRTCALMKAGTVKCWGAGYLGDGLSAGSQVPVDVKG